MMRIHSLFLLLLLASQLLPMTPAIGRDRVEECPKRTFGYNQPWVPRTTNPVWIAQAVVPVACTNCAEVISTPVISMPVLYGAVSEGVHLAQSPLTVVPYPAPFSLCVACPENATVIIDGRVGKSTARVRQYELSLPIGIQAKAIRMVVVDQRQKVLWEGRIIATAGESETIVVTKESTNDFAMQQVTMKEVVTDSATNPSADSAKQEIQELTDEIGLLRKSIGELVATQPKSLKTRKNQLDTREKEMEQEKNSRDTMQNARDKLQDERDQLQQRRDKLQTERDTLQVARENDFTVKRNSLIELRTNLDKFQQTREKLQDARDALQRERDALQQRRDKLQAERDAKH